MEEMDIPSSNQQSESEHEILPANEVVPKEQGVPMMMSMMKQLEGVMMEKGKMVSGSTEFFSQLTESQRGNLISTIDKHEDNAKEVYMKRLEITQDLRTKEINASIVTQKTNRYLYIGGLIGFVVLTLMILFFKDAYIVPWLTFITGLAGGFGIGKSTNNQPVEKSSGSILKDLDEE